jgi:hypothetical protein
MSELQAIHAEYSGMQATKNRAKERGFRSSSQTPEQSALARLETWVLLVDHVETSAPAHNLAAATAFLECLQ